MEMGIQTLHNHVHVANVRGHDNQAIVDAMFKLRQYGFKISNHYMPGLYKSTPEQDLETFQMAFNSPSIKSDELKFYPTAVIPNTPLYDLRKSGEYSPIKDEPLEKLIRTFKTEIIPPYARIKRLARDFDTNEVVAGANTPNLRQLVMNDMEKEYTHDSVKRIKQFERLATDLHVLENINEVGALIDALSPLEKTALSST
jgi:elongator complex protein 3